MQPKPAPRKPARYRIWPELVGAEGAPPVPQAAHVPRAVDPAASATPARHPLPPEQPRCNGVERAPRELFELCLDCRRRTELPGRAGVHFARLPDLRFGAAGTLLACGQYLAPRPRRALAWD